MLRSSAYASLAATAGQSCVRSLESLSFGASRCHLIQSGGGYTRGLTFCYYTSKIRVMGCLFTHTVCHGRLSYWYAGVHHLTTLETNERDFKLDGSFLAQLTRSVT